jgi:uncharacterized protein YgbK (DUF1537 family)
MEPTTMPNTKIIILDDDPTGSQTVHSCLLLTRWDVASLRDALLDTAPLFFVLTNTRGMEATRAADLTREVCRNLKQALDEVTATGKVVHPLFVSRSDSTLRGHYPVETDVMAEELGPFDAHFLVPAFFEGGRITRDGVHYLMVDGEPVPTSETEFAKDSVFGYSTSYLPDYVAEKTRGRIAANQVERFFLPCVRGNALPRLLGLKNNACAVVDAEIQADLNHFARQLKAAAGKGKRFLFRSAASLITALAGLPAQPVPAQRMAAYVRDGRPGAVLVGSHVKKSTAQLHRLLQEPGMAPIEVDVARLPMDRERLVQAAIEIAAEAHAAGLTPVIHTSRIERQFASQAERLAFGEVVSGTLMDIVRGLPTTLGFLISKGGITSNDVLSTGLNLTASRVVGQVLAGCSVVCCPDDHARYPGMPVVIFPGNVGDDAALATVWRRLARPDLSPAEQLAA